MALLGTGYWTQPSRSLVFIIGDFHHISHDRLICDTVVSQQRFELTSDIFILVPQALIHSVEEHILDCGWAVPHVRVRLFDSKEYFLLKAYYPVQELLRSFGLHLFCTH